MLPLFLAFFTLWQLAVILFQFCKPFRAAMERRHFYLCGLFPAWRMFGPDPADGDYLVYYRTASNNVYTDWRLADYDKKSPLLLTLFYNPRGNIVKALREICQEIVRSRSEYNGYYQLMLNDLIRQTRTESEPVKEPAEASTRIQFQIRWQTPERLSTLFSSHAHRY